MAVQADGELGSEQRERSPAVLWRGADARLQLLVDQPQQPIDQVHNSSVDL